MQHQTFPARSVFQEAKPLDRHCRDKWALRKAFYQVPDHHKGHELP